MKQIDRLHRDLNAFFTPRAGRARPTASTTWIARLPDGREHVIERRHERSTGRSAFLGLRPDGGTYETSLRDVKAFMTREFPGVTFTRRHPKA
ncbi:MAG: hypothetical protein LC676_10815 [Loktanella sp.]|nr:hypothetical protein [Loktanella sp.]